jgi:hypothetical protein
VDRLQKISSRTPRSLRALERVQEKLPRVSSDVEQVHRGEIAQEESRVDIMEKKPMKRTAPRRDACYYKVKARYKSSAWPSAYASGALVKCRRVGAAKWGESKSKPRP